MSTSKIFMKSHFYEHSKDAGCAVRFTTEVHTTAPELCNYCLRTLMSQTLFKHAKAQAAIKNEAIFGKNFTHIIRKTMGEIFFKLEQSARKPFRFHLFFQPFPSLIFIIPIEQWTHYIIRHWKTK